MRVVSAQPLDDSDDSDMIQCRPCCRHLASLLPVAQLVVLPGGTHDLAVGQADVIAPLIDRHLRRALFLADP